MRLAWFTPLPPQRSGISSYSAELLPLLAAHHQVDAVVAPGTRVEPPARTAVVDLWEFQRRHLHQPYDAIVYQLGNARFHDYMWAALFRYPGLVVLHDGQLHHARARALLHDGSRADDYRAEFAANHPEAPPSVAEFAVNGLGGSPYFLWPMRRLVIEQARLVAVHTAVLTQMLRDEHPGVPIVHVPPGMKAYPDAPPPTPGAGVLFGAFGLMTEEKRIPQVLEAFARVRREVPHARLVLAGGVAPHFDLASLVSRLGIDEAVSVTGYVDDEVLDEWVSRVDVALCLRWPSSGETSAVWLRCLAAGRPTITTDLAYTSDVPSVEARLLDTGRVDGAPPPARGGASIDGAVTVVVDVLDEVAQLERAMRRLASDVGLRERLGRNARAHWARHHTQARALAAYENALQQLVSLPIRPTPPRPAHLDADGSAIVDGVTAVFGVPSPW